MIVMEKRGKKVKRFSIRISPEDKELISEIASYNNISEADLISYLVHDLLNEGGKTIKSEIRIKSPRETGQRQ